MSTILANLGKLTALLLALAAGMSWWLAPEPQAPRAARSGDESWSLPRTGRGNPEKSLAAIGAANLWGTVQTATTRSLTDPDWRFSGVTINGKDKTVMITTDGQFVQTLKAGDLLPGGAKILTINDDHLCLLIKGKKRKLDLF